jgi:hypothetical protein
MDIKIVPPITAGIRTILPKMIATINASFISQSRFVVPNIYVCLKSVAINNNLGFRVQRFKGSRFWVQGFRVEQRITLKT